ncbi:MAG: DUF1036 domain-containing protein [Parasphingorhabdus sp.]|uniref:DUF1036 domain-containing protein n=1 Tax=Parasphingorhabdus sp. TaxID=2709688 RepID=UPI0032999711
MTIASLLGASGIVLPPAATAEGSSISLSKFCDGKYRTGLLRGLQSKIGAKWNPKKKKWECWIPRKFGYGIVTEGSYRSLSYAEACRKMRGTSAYHGHGRTVHCGRKSVRPPDPPQQSRPAPPSNGYGRGQAEYTALQMCNRSRTDTIYAAWVWHDWGENRRPKNWRAQGWIKLRRGQCERVEFPHYRNGDPYEDTVYLHATSEHIKWGQSDYSFCVHPSDFDHIESDRMACTARGQRLVRMFEFQLVPAANNNFNFN